MNWGNYLFSFSGRINRARMWLYILIAIVLDSIAVAMCFPLVMASVMPGASPAGLAAIGAVQLAMLCLAGLIMLLVVFTGLAVTVKRLHDRNKSGWWILVFYVLPGFIAPFGDTHYGLVHNEMVALPFALINVVIAIWAFVEIYCLRGTVGENRFGPDPLASA